MKRLRFCKLRSGGVFICDCVTRVIGTSCNPGVLFRWIEWEDGMTEEMEYFQKYRSLYEEAVLRYVCTRCIDFGNDGVCHSEDPKGCAVFRYLPELIAIARRIHEPSIVPYVDAVRQTVCVHCRALTPEGMCPLRAKLDCGLDRYLILVIEAMGKVDAILKNEEKDRDRLSNESKNITSLLIQRCRRVLDRIFSLDEMLRGFCYSGETAYQENLIQMNEVSKFFSREWNKHMTIEKEILFPFAIAHLPQIRPAIDFLESKHAEYRKKLQELRTRYDDFKWAVGDEGRKKAVEKFQNLGISLAKLFNEYIEIEAKNVYKVLDRELSEDDKLELMRKIYLRNVSRRAA